MKVLLRRPWLIPVALFLVILLHGSLLGLTDDEAYYWVLAQRPALGYAYHPPAVALLIAFSQALIGWVAGPASAFVVRLPAALCAALIVGIGMKWIRRAGASRPGLGGLALLSIPGIFGLAWMMVPDLPLFLGWTLAFAATWEICRASDREAGMREWAGLSAGITLAVLSKYSGIMAALSAAWAIYCWAPRERRIRGLASVALGCALAAVPILWWNATHEWASILYQVRERHGGASLSLLRYLRFWVIEWVIAGPPLVIYSALLIARWSRNRVSDAERFAIAWIVPGAGVFFLQPLWADFKPHWALIAWWGFALAMGWGWASGERQARRLARWQLGYGIALSALVMLGCHLPVMAWVTERFSSRPMDPRIDVTNDLHGWGDLRSFIAEKGGPEASRLPIVAVRYQPASQAAFAMGKGAPVTMLPRDLKAMDEWPDVRVSDGQGPEWPRLTAPVLYVADNRYESQPEYRDASCRKEWTLRKERWGFLAKEIYIWRCEPVR